MMLSLKDVINNFLKYVNAQNIELYNEFSLQHELGIFIREKYPNYKVQFERNVTYFFPGENNTTKHEIDIVIFKPDLSEKYAIELKFPRNGQYPEQMYAFIKDIVFMEEVKTLGFNATCTLTVVDNKNFYTGKFTSDNIYRFFRESEKYSINGRITKPTGDTSSFVDVKGNYDIKWENFKNFKNLKYYFLEI